MYDRFIFLMTLNNTGYRCNGVFRERAGGGDDHPGQQTLIGGT